MFELYGNSPVLDSSVHAGTFPNRRARLLDLYNTSPDINQVTRIDPGIDFNWGNSAPSPGMGPDTFSARWTGEVDIPQSGSYTFHAESDDGVRVWVGDTQVIDGWMDHPATWVSGTLPLTAGRHALRVEYFDGVDLASMRLLWTPPGATGRQPIPVQRLFTAKDSTTQGLLAEYFDNASVVAPGCGTFLAPPQHTDCPGSEALTARLAMCQRMTQGLSLIHI